MDHRKANLGVSVIHPSDVKQLFEMIAFEQPVIVTGSRPCTTFSQFQNWSWYREWEKWQAMKLLLVAVDVYEEQIRARRHFLQAGKTACLP